ncbi:putative TIM-barrel fold metal-dependent hydrolase [Aequorivita sublithincola DSM 14238]|uniref:Putative TIM-barrel fold metal-dependent hydrolase n=1 Tax=Aequorivita sublithincola (strain DSM 14238 / LMG 21431 / ACAM 643 / 9-3) TaxID=746697 RepID=I3YTG6_AEQSU|nr:amidohydrolase [Aequorivita sublithincola]AFL80284.1 putative TIM-barrel fold metal-dependent hydrolase [Aequorivita sublithincola DSM 14238]
MKYTLYIVIAVAFFYSCKNESTSKSVDTTSEASSQLYFNGDIITMNSDTPEYVEAVVEQKGKIVFIGSKKDAEAKYPEAEKVDLKGKTLLPGFIDPHSHFGMVSNSMGQVDLNPEPVGTVTNIPDIAKRIKAYKTDNNIPDGEWIFGWGYDDGQLKEQRHPTKSEIDAVLPNNPVYLQHTSGHMGVANSMALKKMNVTAETPNPDGGNIERMPNSKEPNGLVQETAMYPFVGNMLQILGKEQSKYFDATQEYYASNGITTAQDGMTDRNTIKFFQSQADAGKLKIDLMALGGNNDLKANLKDSTIHFKTYKNHFKVQGTKIVADGSPQGKTAFFTEPFLTEVPGCTHDCRGLPSLTKETLNELFVTAYADDNQLFIHSNGDATIDMVIAAHENACKKLGQSLDKDRRTIVIHSQFVRPDQLEIFKKYNMEPSFFTNHAFFWGDEHVKNLGKERADFLSPMASAIRIGLKPTNHSDATVTPVNPLFTIWSAVNRVSRSGATIGESEKITPYQALQAITTNAAYEFFEEDSKGSLLEGKLADFVILEKNPLKVDAMTIKDIQVLETIKEGKTVFKKQ